MFQVLKTENFKPFFFFKRKAIDRRVVGSSQDDIDSVTGAPHRASSKAGEPTQGGAGLWFLSNAPGSHSISARSTEQHSRGRRDPGNPKIPRGSFSPEPRARLEVSLWVQQLVTLWCPRITVKTHNLHIQTSVKRGCLMGKKVSHKTFGHGNRQ